MLEAQLEALAKRYPGASARPLAAGGHCVCVPQVRTGAAWSKPRTDVRFVAPTGYPYANPDCFWADPDLRLAGGAMPASSGISAPPESSENGLWFSWHLKQPWDPNRDTLLTWMAVIADRFRTGR